MNSAASIPAVRCPPSTALWSWAVAFLALIVVLAAFLAPPPAAHAAGRVWYVIPGGTGNGSSWATGVDLSTLTSLGPQPGDEVWVKAGTYATLVSQMNYYGAAPYHTAGSPFNVVLPLRNGVKYYGGFAGTETSRSQRNWAANNTVLSAGSGPLDIVWADSVNSDTVLDGFTIDSAGRAAHGIMLYGSSPLLANLVVMNVYQFVPVYNYLGGRPTLVNTLIRGNEVHSGANLYWPILPAPFVNDQGGDITLVNVTIANNYNRNNDYLYGGPTALYTNSGRLTLLNSIVWGNTGDNPESLVLLQRDYQLPDGTWTMPELDVNYSDVQGGYTPGGGVYLGGLGVINADPQFNVDLTLQPASPAADHADMSSLPADRSDMDGDSNTTEAIPFDRGHNARVRDYVLDMGAYEAAPATSTNHAPVLNSGTPALDPISEDVAVGSNPGTLVSTLANLAGLITDADAGALKGLAITTADNTKGRWQYSLNGTTWYELGSPTGGMARLLAPDASTRLRFLPNADACGSASLTIRAWDQTNGYNGLPMDTTTNGGTTAVSSATGSATIQVTCVNDPPTISGIEPQRVKVSQNVTVNATVGDDLTAPGATTLDGLTLSGASDNTAVIPVSGITFGGSGASRTVTVTPTAGAIGVANITVTVSDGQLTANTTFEVTVYRGVLYVVPGGKSSGSCDTWANGCTLSHALDDVAVSGDEIWAKYGEYTANLSRGDNSVCKFSWFALKSGIKLYGSFSGNETTRPARYSGFVPSSTLNGTGSFNYPACHTVYIDGLSNVVLDGFTITGGTASSGWSGPAYHGYGGGIFVKNSSNVRLAHLLFDDNWAGDGGGGLYSEGNTNLTVVNSGFKANAASYGGGIYSADSPRLVNVTLTGNGNPNPPGNMPTVGGGYYVAGGSPTLTNVVFSGNLTASNKTGGGLYVANGSPVLKNTTFHNNQAPYGTGGGIYVAGGSLTLQNSIVWGNTANTSPNVHVAGGSLNASYSDVQGGYVGTGNINADPLFMDAASAYYELAYGSPAVNTGDASLLPADVADLDGDANTAETLPWDLNWGPRVGNGSLDMGAHELHIWYVRTDGGATMGCASWADACAAPTTALAKAHAGDHIWVAGGLYRTSQMSLLRGMQLIGGWAGWESDFSQRDLVAHPTTLSGDRNNNGFDAGDAPFVVSMSSAPNAAVDGFTLRDGYYTGTDETWGGAGVSVGDGSPKLANLTVTHNKSAGAGGGIYIYRGSPTLTNVTVTDNTAVTGAGIYIVATSDAQQPTFTNVSVTDNTASGNGGGLYLKGPVTIGNVNAQRNHAASGGGLYVTKTYSGESVSLSTITVSDNTASSNGGGVAIASIAVAATNLTVSGNTATGNGGGVYADTSGGSTFTNVTIAGNTAGNGGGVYATASSSATGPTFKNSIVWGNTPTSPQIRAVTTTPAVTYSDVQGGFTGTGNVSGDPKLRPLGAYGGPLLTRGLLPGSAATNTATATGCPAKDERGVTRPQGGACDMGAYEAGPVTLAKAGGDGQSAAINTAFPAALTVAVLEGGSDAAIAVPGQAIAFSAPASGASATPATGNATTNEQGLASLSVSANGLAGQYNVTASLASPSQQVTFGLTNTASTAMTLTSSLNPADYGAPVNLTATVTSPGGTPNGSVAFKDGGTDITGCTAVALNGSGAAACTVTLPAGDHPITAAYAGNAGFGSSNAALTQTVNACEAAPVVNTAVDAGAPAGSLRWAIGAACPGATVTFAGDYTILLGSTIDINKDITVDATGHAVTVDGGDAVRLFTLGSAGHVTVRHLTFTRGKSTGNGGAFYVNTNATLALESCAFTSNTAVNGGAIYSTSGLTVSSCTFTGNQATGGSGNGGALSVSGGAGLIVTGSSFADNTAFQGAGMFAGAGNATITDTVFQHNTASSDGWGGGLVLNSSGAKRLTRVTFTGNSAYAGGGLAVLSSSQAVILDHVTFLNNTATDTGGGLYTDPGGPLTGYNVLFSGNTAAYIGGGAFAYGALSLTNVVFTGNSAGWGGGLFTDRTASTQQITNATFSNNRAAHTVATDYSLGGGYAVCGSATVRNSIFWGNTAQDGGPQFDLCDGGNGTANLTVSYSDIQGGWAGTGNINADPLLADADGADNVYGTADDDARLGGASPASDAGDNAAVSADSQDLDEDGNTTEPLPFDLDGLPRFCDNAGVADTGGGAPPIVDMGPYEVCSLAAPVVTIAIDGSDVVLTTPRVAGLTYHLWRSAQPYLAPGDGTAQELAGACTGDATVTCRHAGAAVDPNIHHFYVVRVLNVGSQWADSVRKGWWGWGLAKGVAGN